MGDELEVLVKKGFVTCTVCNSVVGAKRIIEDMIDSREKWMVGLSSENSDYTKSIIEIGLLETMKEVL